MLGSFGSFGSFGSGSSGGGARQQADLHGIVATRRGAAHFVYSSEQQYGCLRAGEHHTNTGHHPAGPTSRLQTSACRAQIDALMCRRRHARRGSACKPLEGARQTGAALPKPHKGPAQRHRSCDGVSQTGATNCICSKQLGSESGEPRRRPVAVALLLAWSPIEPPCTRSVRRTQRRARGPPPQPRRAAAPIRGPGPAAVGGRRAHLGEASPCTCSSTAFYCT